MGVEPLDPERIAVKVIGRPVACEGTGLEIKINQTTGGLRRHRSRNQIMAYVLGVLVISTQWARSTRVGKRREFLLFLR